MRLVAAIALLTVAACGTPQNTPADSGSVNCASDPRVMNLKPGFSVSSATGRSYELVSVDPAPPSRGNNSWVLKVKDSGGNGLSGLPLTVLPFMPDHGHGTSVKATVTAQPDGTYTVAPLYFFMPGVWRVTFDEADAGTPDPAQFLLCVPG